MTRPDDPTPAAMRLDKWLWHARFFRTRGLATRVAATGKVRVNARRAARASVTVVPGDVLTFAAGGRVRVVRVRALGLRRGPATEARSLYEDLDQPADATAPGAGLSGPDALD